MGYRKLENIDDRILCETIKMGAELGVPNVSSKKLAVRCDISNCTIFNKFGTMQELLDAAAQSFDRPHMALVVQMAQQHLTADEIWDDMLEHFLSDPNGTLYYISYTNTFGFDPTVNNPRAPEFLRIAKVFFRPEAPLTDNQYLILWDYITSMGFYYAEKFIHHYMSYDDDSKAFVKRIVFDGISDILHNPEKQVFSTVK